MKRITKIAENKDNVSVKKLRVAAYCRVSTANDEQLVSLEAQKAYYENYIKNNDEWEFAGLYYDDGVSGTRFDRPGFTAMMEEVESGRVEAIVVKDMSRLGGDYLKVGQVMEILRQQGVWMITISVIILWRIWRLLFLKFRSQSSGGCFLSAKPCIP